MGFNQYVAEEALVKCGRHCCLCHKFCGTKIELHHIKSKNEGGDDSLENCIPLCFDCHAEVKAYNTSHPKGKMYTEEELSRHRDRWFEKINKGEELFQDESYARLDKEVFVKITNLLDTTMKDLIKEFDFGGSFEIDKLRPLSRFVNISDNPELEFLDPDLESAKKNLYLKVNEFLDCISSYTFSDKGLRDDLRGIPKDWDQDKYNTARNKLNKASDELWKQYFVFIRSCRIRLMDITT